jgi:hypothetical protein
MKDKSVDFMHLFVYSGNCYEIRQRLKPHVTPGKVIWFASKTNYVIWIAGPRFRKMSVMSSGNTHKKTVDQFSTILEIFEVFLLKLDLKA